MINFKSLVVAIQGLMGAYKFYEDCLFCIQNKLCHDIRHLSDMILLHCIIFVISYVTKSFSAKENFE